MRAVFLDRDGVINKYQGDSKYVTSWKAFKFLPRAKEAIKNLSGKGLALFVISNQAGVGKGEFSKESLARITRNMLREVEKSGGRIKKVYYCTHRKEENCSCRKPKAGLIHKALKVHILDLKKSFFVGDTIRDVKAAHAAGCRSILVLCGKEKLSKRKNWETQPDFIFKNLFQASEFILNNL